VYGSPKRFSKDWEVSSLKLLDQYQEMHRRGFFKGMSLKKHIPELQNLLYEHKCKTILDYGSGKGQVHEEYDLGEVTLYDPGVIGIDFLPSGTFDAVICTDVLEHIPEDELDETLNNIFSKAEKFVYLSVSTIPAKKTLPNGLNAHVTVKPKDWWLERIKPHAKQKYIVNVSNAE